MQVKHLNIEETSMITQMINCTTGVRRNWKIAHQIVLERKKSNRKASSVHSKQDIQGTFTLSELDTSDLSADLSNGDKLCQVIV